MLSKEQSLFIITVTFALIIQNTLGQLLSDTCNENVPSPVIQRIPLNISVEYYHNESSMTTSHWCVDREYVWDHSLHCIRIQLSGGRLIYTPSSDDESVQIYLLDGMDSDCKHFNNRELVTIYSTLTLKGNNGAKIIITNAVKADHVCEKRNLTNGSVKYSTCTEELGVPIGTVATYSCDSGYTLVGNPTQTCQLGSNNVENWSDILPNCKPNTCEGLMDPLNGIVTNMDATNKIVSVGTETSYTCDPGFRLSSSETRVCMPDGNWSGQTATCTMITCNQLDHPQNGKTTYSSWPVANVSVPAFAVGTSTSHTCEPGFKLSSKETRICMPDGNWSGQNITCILIMCDHLDRPRNGQVTYSDQPLTNGSVAIYTCDEGFEAVSRNSKRVCQLQSDENATWTGESVECNPAPTKPAISTAPQFAVAAPTTIVGIIAGLILGVLLGIVLTNYLRCLYRNRSISRTPDTCESFENKEH